MRGGGTFEVSLRPLDAPTNVDRFARLVSSNYFDGLTFHRVVPNFVVQGGSPGANEYWGDAPFTRDELTTEEHLRGTVGISTRGRDTGDGQIFVNLVDNPRLDHEYTIVGEITSGMDVVDGLVEGATFEKVELVTAAPAK
jgi:cyclophilin family peptidyl-prolyl cis-trans isomerase